MGTINLDSPFVSYNLSEEEIRQGSILGDLNKQVIHNLLFQAVMEKIYLPQTPENVKHEAELAGTIRILQTLIDNHKAALAESVASEPPPEHQPNPDISGIFPRARMSSSAISLPSDDQ